jgi:hypothetical protein
VVLASPPKKRRDALSAAAIRLPIWRALRLAHAGPLRLPVGQWIEPTTTVRPLVLSTRCASTFSLRSSVSPTQPLAVRRLERNVTLESDRKENRPTR